MNVRPEAGCPSRAAEIPSWPAAAGTHIAPDGDGAGDAEEA